MSSPWAMRIAEGFVIGISGVITWFLFTGMNDARVELMTSRDLLDVQIELNEELLNRNAQLTSDLNRVSSQVSTLSTRITRVESNLRVGTIDLFEGPELPTMSTPPQEVVSPASSESQVSSPETTVRHNDLQQLIDRQRTIRK